MARLGQEGPCRPCHSTWKEKGSGGVAHQTDGDFIGYIAVSYFMEEKLGEDQARKGWKSELVKLHCKMMRYNPPHLGTGDKIEKDVEMITSRTPTKSH